MSFSETEKGTLAEILGVNPLVINDHLNLVVSDLTTETEDLIQADIVLWATYRSDFINVHPNTANFGAEIKPAEARAAIRNRIANWLTFKMEISSSAGFSRLARS